MKKEIEIPFDKEGNHIIYDGYEWKIDKKVPNYIFSDVLEYIGFSRGRSALNIEWQSYKTRKIYYSGMYMLDSILKGDTKCVVKYNETVNNKLSLKIEGSFTFKKQGTSVLLKEID